MRILHDEVPPVESAAPAVWPAWVALVLAFAVVFYVAFHAAIYRIIFL